MKKPPRLFTLRNVVLYVGSILAIAAMIEFLG
jgi:hypothetical protein